MVLAGRSILLIDDDVSASSDIKAALEAVGAHVVCCDCSRAVVLAERPFLAAAVLDCDPPSSDRRAIIRRLRERRVPFVIYGSEPPSTVTSGQSAPYVAKPSRPEVLIAALRLLLSPAQG